MSSENDDDRDDDVIQRLEDAGAALRRRPSVKGAVMRRVMERRERGTTTAATTQRPHPRGRWTVGGAVGVAAAVAVVALIWRTQGPDGAREAYAAAIGQVERARTFSCRQVSRDFNDAGEAETREMRIMFKEPDKERIEYGRGIGSDGQVMVTDYTTRRRLVLLTVPKTAQVQDVTSMFDLDTSTGRLSQSKLHTETRDNILKMAGDAVTDAGEQRIAGRPARVLKSEGKNGLTKTVWVDEQTKAPLQVKLEWKGRRGTFAYYDIHIDQNLDDALFSTDPPAGYAVTPEYHPAKPAAADHLMRLMTKMRHLTMACYVYANKHGGSFPEKLEDVVGIDGITAASLRVMVSGSDDGGGPPAIVYRRPAPGKYPPPDLIVMYEAEGSRVDGKIAAAFGDGHAEVMTDDAFAKAMNAGQ